MKTGNNRALRRIIATFLPIALISFQYGCAELPYRLPPPLSEAQREELGTIAVVAADFAPQAALFTHSWGRVKGAAKGMTFDHEGGGVAFPFPLGSGSSEPVLYGAPGAAAVFVGIIAVGALIYAGHRAATATPAEETEKADSDLKKVLLQLKMQESLKERFVQIAREQTGFDFIGIEDEGPKKPDDILKYDHLREKGFDTVIELSILSVGFQGGGGRDPLLSLLVDARTRVFSVSGGAIIYENKLEYRGAKRRFTEWLSDKGRLFCDELDRGYLTLSEKMVEELFLIYDFTNNRRSNS